MKRFTETEKWKDGWYMNLSPTHKLTWIYLIDSCDCAGIWDVNEKLLDYQIGEHINLDEFLKQAEHRITPFGRKWLITSFIRFQYGEVLNKKNSAHRGVINRLTQYNIPSPIPIIDLEATKDLYKTQEGAKKGLHSPCQAPQDKDKDKDKDSIKERGMGKTIPSNETEAIEMQGLAPKWSKEFALKIFNEMQGINWIDGVGREVKSWPHYLSSRWAKEESFQNEKQVRSNGTNGYSKPTPARSQQEIQEATAKAQEVAANAWKHEPHHIANNVRHGVSNGDVALTRKLTDQQRDYFYTLISPERKMQIQEKMNGYPQRTH